MTATEEAQDHDEPESQTAARRRVVLIALAAVVVAGAVFVAVDAVLLSTVRIDKYDDTIRGLRPGTQRVDFEQAIGPDGDGCWPENSRDFSGRVFCDLVSIGGLHWDTGDVRVADSVNLILDSGYLCLVDEDAAPWCWEWSPDVQPRPARVPQGATFRRIVGAGGFVCGQTPDYVTVACWTVGVYQPEYRQATHRFDDGPERVMRNAYDDPPGFTTNQRETRRTEHFHPFSGTVGRPLETETAS